jgi:hypothetical protein
VLLMKGEFDLKRLEITAATRTWLEWKKRITGKTPQEFVRQLLHEQALRETADAKLLAVLSASDGTSADSGGREP